jgi:hypothetical protein
LRTREGDDFSLEALDALENAVEADQRTLGASVAGEEDGASVFLSVDATSPTDAKAVSDAIVKGALAQLGLETEASALQVYDEEGNFIP